MGTVTIHDGDSTRRYRLTSLDDDHRVDVAWPSRATAPTAPQRAVPDGGRTTAAPEVGRTDADREYERGPTARGARDGFAWLAIAPFVLTVVGLVAGLVFGFGVFETTAANVSPYAVLVPYFLVGLAGTLWIYHDADDLAAADADWQPNPWLYVLGGGCVLELYYLAPVLRGDVEPPVVPYLAGGFVVATLLSAVVAGPVYLFVRRRALD